MISAEELKEVLDYDPNTGVFVWKYKKNVTRLKGKLAGCVDHKWGYWIIKIKGKSYKAHRLAFLYVTGRWPYIVDHVDRDPSNNAWVNLRECTPSENQRNKTSLTNKKHKTVKGVNWHKSAKKWQVRVMTDEGRLDLGRYDDLELAELIATEAVGKYHGEYARV